MKKEKNYIARIQIPLYGSELFLYNDRAKYTKDTKDAEVGESRTSAIGGTISHTDDKCTFWVGIFDNSIDCICHECFHVAVQLLHDRGIPISAENDETVAYLLSWLVKTISKHLEKESNGNQS